MKKVLLSLSLAFITTIAVAQFGTAHDFTVTDINGDEFHLYEHLDAGKVVVLDVSATWCPPCWTFHQGHYLQDLHEMYGPDGTDQLRVMFYEGDANTTMADLEGTTSNTMGNWIEGTTYPIVNESPLQLDLSVYAPQGFPTVSIIRPSDYEITADVWNATSLGQIEGEINEIITLGEETSSLTDLTQVQGISVYPNPTVELITLDLNELAIDADEVTMLDATGKVVLTQKVTAGGIYQFLTADLAAGTYFFNLSADGKPVATRKFAKK